MKLLTKMMHLQEQHGAVTDSMLREMSREEGVPLYRLEGLRGFYPVFRATPGRKTQVQVCRDIVCMMKSGPQFCSKVKSALSNAADVEVEEVSCVGRCDTAPAATINEVPVSGSVETITAYATGKKPLPSNAPTTAPRRWPTDPYANEKGHYSVIKKFLKPGDD